MTPQERVEGAELKHRSDACLAEGPQRCPLCQRGVHDQDARELNRGAGVQGTSFVLHTCVYQPCGHRVPIPEVPLLRVPQDYEAERDTPKTEVP